MCHFVIDNNSGVFERFLQFLQRCSIAMSEMSICQSVTQRMVGGDAPFQKFWTKVTSKTAISNLYLLIVPQQ